MTYAAGVLAVQYDAFGLMPYLTERADPIAPANGVVIAVAATGLCRSDWHGWQGHDSDIQTLPHVPGHEFAGTIAQVGDGVANWQAGDRVTVPFVCGCGTCSECRSGNAQVCAAQWQPGFSGPGSFAQFVAIPNADFNLVALPDDVTMAAAAGLGCRFATAFRAVTLIGRVQPGEQVVVLGCGGVGLSAVMIAAALGAEVTAVDISAAALHMATAFGARYVVNSAGEHSIDQTIRELLNGGADVTLDALGSIETARAAVAALKPRGRHVQVGLLPPAEIGDRATVPMHLVIGRELEILGSHGMSARDYPAMLEMIAAGTLNPQHLVTNTLGLAEAAAALAGLGNATNPGVSVITL